MACFVPVRRKGASVMKTVLGAAAALTLAWASPALAATQIVVGGKLTGATGVNVAGTLYDVTLVEGTCADVFAGCDSVSDFDFTDSADAANAVQALIDEVFVGAFDFPSDIFGCDNPSVCNAIVPFALEGPEIQTWAALNFDAGPSATTDFSFTQFFNTSTTGLFVWATFAPSQATPVPEPSTWAMLLLGFAAMGWAFRRQRSGASAIG
jgi:hypothetical protein